MLCAPRNRGAGPPRRCNRHPAPCSQPQDAVAPSAWHSQITSRGQGSPEVLETIRGIWSGHQQGPMAGSYEPSWSLRQQGCARPGRGPQPRPLPWLTSSTHDPLGPAPARFLAALCLQPALLAGVGGPSVQPSLSLQDSADGSRPRSPRPTAGRLCARLQLGRHSRGTGRTWAGYKVAWDPGRQAGSTDEGGVGQAAGALGKRQISFHVINSLPEG